MKKIISTFFICVFVFATFSQSATQKAPKAMSQSKPKSTLRLKTPAPQSNIKLIHNRQVKSGFTSKPTIPQKPNLKSPHPNKNNTDFKNRIRRPKIHIPPPTHNAHIRAPIFQTTFFFDNSNWNFLDEYSTQAFIVDIREKIVDLLWRKNIKNIKSLEISVLELTQNRDTITAKIEAKTIKISSGKEVLIKTTTTASAFTENFLKNKIAQEIVSKIE